MTDDTTTVETPAVAESPTVAEFAAQAEQIEALRAMVAGLAVPGAVTEPTQDFADLREFLLTFAAANKGDAVAVKRLEQFVLDTDTTTTAAGLVPDYFSQDIIGIIDTQRPYLSSIMADPVGSQGMNAQYPRRTQKPSVDVQSAQLTEVSSQATTFDFLTVPLVSYAGASQVALQLIERSAPSFVTRLFQEYAGVYAEKTSLDAITNLIANAAVANTEVLADFSTDPAATWAAVSAASADIVAATRRNPDLFVVAPDRWGQLTAMLDTTKRPLVTFGPGGPTNAMGVGGEFSNLQANWNGLRVVVEPSAAAGSAVLMWSGAANYLEQSPQEMRALQVSIAGMELGIWSLFAHVVKYPDGVYTFTTA